MRAIKPILRAPAAIKRWFTRLFCSHPTADPNGVRQCTKCGAAWPGKEGNDQ